MLSENIGTNRSSPLRPGDLIIGGKRFSYLAEGFQSRVYGSDEVIVKVPLSPDEMVEKALRLQQYSAFPSTADIEKHYIDGISKHRIVESYLQEVPPAREPLAGFRLDD